MEVQAMGRFGPVEDVPKMHHMEPGDHPDLQFLKPKSFHINPSKIAWLQSLVLKWTSIKKMLKAKLVLKEM